MKYLVNNNLKIDKLILVSGFNNYYSNDKNDFHNIVNKTFYIADGELNKIKELCNKIICIYGDNDSYIPQNVFHNLAIKLDADEIIIPNGGHLNKESGYTEFETIKNLLESE